MPFTLRNLKGDLEDVGPRFGGAPDLEFRLATKALELEKSGLSYQRVPPGYRFPYGHTHKKQEEVYVVLHGSGRMKEVNVKRDPRRPELPLTTKRADPRLELDRRPSRRATRARRAILEALAESGEATCTPSPATHPSPPPHAQPDDQRARDAKDPGELIRDHGRHGLTRAAAAPICGITARALELTGPLADLDHEPGRRAGVARASAWMRTLHAHYSIEQTTALDGVADTRGYDREAVRRTFRARHWRTEPEWIQSGQGMDR